MAKVIEKNDLFVYDKYRKIPPLLDPFDFVWINYKCAFRGNIYSQSVVQEYLDSVFPCKVSVYHELFGYEARFSDLELMSEYKKARYFDYLYGFVVHIAENETYQELLNDTLHEKYGWIPCLLRINYEDKFLNIHRITCDYKKREYIEFLRAFLKNNFTFMSYTICYMYKYEEI